MLRGMGTYRFALYEFDITTSRNMNGKWFKRLQAYHRTVVAVAHYIKLVKSAYE